MQLSHTSPALSASFDEPNLVSAAGLVPVMALAGKAGLQTLATRWLSLPGDKGAHAGLKVASLVAGMVAGADSIDDMALLRHGGMGKLFPACYAPSTLGSFLRAFTFGHVRQLDAVASRFLTGLAGQARLLDDGNGFVFLDIDDTIVEVHGYQKQAAGVGYSGIRGLNVLLATASTKDSAPLIAGQRLRRGLTASPRGAAKLVTDTIGSLRRLPGATGRPVLVRADSAYYAHKVVTAATRAGAQVSVTVRNNPAIRAAIASIDAQRWQTIRYTDAVKDDTTGAWISSAEVAETAFTAFTSKKKTDQISGRLIVRRVPALNPKALPDQPTLFETYRYHAFFTTVEETTLNTVTADQLHRRHAIIEQVNADLKNSALAHLPSGVFTANAAWLVLACIAFNLTRAAGILAGTGLAKATTGTLRRKLISIPARIATSARRHRLHLPKHWPWESAWQHLFTIACGPPAPATP